MNQISVDGVGNLCVAFDEAVHVQSVAFSLYCNAGMSGTHIAHYLCLVFMSLQCLLPFIARILEFLCT